MKIGCGKVFQSAKKMKNSWNKKSLKVEYSNVEGKAYKGEKCNAKWGKKYKSSRKR